MTPYREYVSGDGSYPLELRKEWVQIMKLSEAVADLLLGGKLTNKEFRVISRGDCDFEYDQWDKAGREAKFWDKKFFPGAVAVYKHDFSWYLIQKK